MAAEVGVGSADGIDGTPPPPPPGVIVVVVIACADGVVGVNASVPAGRAGETDEIKHIETFIKKIEIK